MYENISILYRTCSDIIAPRLKCLTMKLYYTLYVLNQLIRLRTGRGYQQQNLYVSVTINNNYMVGMLQRDG